MLRNFTALIEKSGKDMKQSLVFYKSGSSKLNKRIIKNGTIYS
jgi:hypothetical protein